jgi:hypothetical protein
MVCAVFKGPVQNLEGGGGLNANFVGIGQPKNTFLHHWNMFPAAKKSQV